MKKVFMVGFDRDVNGMEVFDFKSISASRGHAIDRMQEHQEHADEDQHYYILEVEVEGSEDDDNT